MHLKSLTLKGFKSFASATTLRFEPGITAVVGPNGSGKSNVVDAIAWVLGEQGAKALRGGKMEDVIFAGTAGRPPLGRAEVALTIDNSDGALPIDYTEVTITRTMFRNGGSEYAINGDTCRLLDVQELLSDSGIGREMHVIVGQGQLDAVLSAGPEERRGFLEEAAGVLKHRKRKEKALRKLDAMQANLTRASDLVTELRRQLKPLGKQAEIARRAATVQADLRDAKLRLLADDLITLRACLDAEVADEAALRARQGQVETALVAARSRESALEEALEAAVPAAAAAQENWYRLSALRERLQGTAGLAAERARLIADDAQEQRPGRDPEELDRDAAAARQAAGELVAVVEQAAGACNAATLARRAVEESLAVEEKAVATAHRAAADRREGLARLAGKVNGLRAHAAACQAEIGRQSEALAEAAARAQLAEAEFTVLESQAAGLADGEVGLDEVHEAAADRLAAAQERLAELQARQQDAGRSRAALRARKEALELGLARRDGGATLLGDPDVRGVLGSLAELVNVTPGHEAAVAAALAGAADAVVVESVPAAVAAIERLRAGDAGQAHLVVGTAAAPDRQPATATGFASLLDSVSAPAELRGVLAHLLADCTLVDDLATAAAFVVRHPDRKAVTPAGDVIAISHAVGGSSGAPSLLEVQAAVDEAAGQLGRQDRLAGELRDLLDQAELERDRAQWSTSQALTRLNESDADLAAVAEQLGRLGAAARAGHAEVQRLDAAIRAAGAARDADLSGLAELEARLVAAEAEPVDTEVRTEDRDRLVVACATARAEEVEARLGLRTAEERATAAAGRADAMARAAVAERQARERAAARRAQREVVGRRAQAVAIGADLTLRRLASSLTVAAAERATAQEHRRGRETELAGLRSSTRELAAELDRLTDSVNRDLLARAEHRMRVENLEQRALDELGVAPDVLVVEYGPDRPVPVTPQPTADAGPLPEAVSGEAVEREAVDQETAPETAPETVVETVDPETVERTVPYVRAEQEKRLREAERALALLGRVNPLALEEFAALEERSTFLTAQLEDLKAGRRDLLKVVAEVDARVEQVFAAAWEDTAREFEGVFSRLFPGGEGKLVLTDPDNMLTTGIEVEARPPGKKVKRLSLLSGGERSLVAVALLVAIFRARPSPFYVLDEVEAALDDTNLGRLITILEELRESSQLIVITHQKRTMEVADALYGVSMRGDGVTTVISQRLREDQPA
ncbi:MAG TPA: chromosome segregation protein SMC [Sporichthyaceae bacterium]|nr:chromosome segregation protein SMC [Sporichthyaceae bacterium]